MPEKLWSLVVVKKETGDVNYLFKYWFRSQIQRDIEKTVISIKLEMKNE